MPVNRELIGYGTRLYAELVEDSDTFTELPKLVSVKPPAAKPAEVKTPHLNQPTRVNPRQPGTLEPGDADFTIYYNAAWHKRLGTWAYNGDIKRWRLIYPNGNGHEFYGYIDEPEIEELKNDAPVTMKLMIHATTGTTFISPS